MLDTKAVNHLFGSLKKSTTVYYPPSGKSVDNFTSFVTTSLHQEEEIQKLGFVNIYIYLLKICITLYI